MVDLLVKVLINAIAVYVAVLVVPQIHFAAADDLLGSRATGGRCWSSP